MAPVFPGIDIKPLVAEVQARAADELDYRLEAEAQQAFADAFRGDPEIVVPDVVAFGERVLVSDWMDSPSSMASVIATGTQAERDHYGELLVRFLFAGPARTGMLHADPHPGNFRIIPDADGSPGQAGRARLRRGRPAARAVAARGDGPADAAGRRRGPRRAARRACAARASSRTTSASTRRTVFDYLAPFVEPTRVERFRFTRDWMREQFERINNPRSPSYTVDDQDQPAAVVPAHPPHLARRHRPAQPARGRGAVPGDPRGVAARLRAVTPDAG